VLFLAGSGTASFYAVSGFREAYREAAAVNKEWSSLLEYCSEREDNFYFMDVYSTVNYAQKIFGDENSELENYDICGGWLAKSPLCGEKYGNFGFSSPRAALLEMDNVFFVAKQGTDLGWLKKMYEEETLRIRMEYREVVAGKFDIIKIKLEEAAE